MKITFGEILVPEPLPEIPYRSGFWNEEPEDAMQQPYTPPGRCLISEHGIVLGEGCFLTQANHGGD